MKLNIIVLAKGRKSMTNVDLRSYTSTTSMYGYLSPVINHYYKKKIHKISDFISTAFIVNLYQIKHSYWSIIVTILPIIKFQ